MKWNGDSRTAFHSLTGEPHRWKSERTGWSFQFSDKGIEPEHGGGHSGLVCAKAKTSV
jgi:hypothetical protein